MLFSGNPDVDWEVTKFLIFASFVVSCIVFWRIKKIFVSLVLFSILANASLYLTILTGTTWFYLNDKIWMFDLGEKYWPLINLVLLAIAIVLYLKKKRLKK